MRPKQQKEPELVPVEPPSPDDIEFEKQLIASHPNRRAKDIRRFEFPEEIEEAVAVYVVRLKGKDQLLAADMADANMSDTERKSMQRTMEAEQREAVRLAILGLVTRDEASGKLVRRIVDQSLPLMEIDDWSLSAWAALRTFFGEMNGVPIEALGKAARGARSLGGASALPANATNVTPPRPVMAKQRDA